MNKLLRVSSISARQVSPNSTSSLWACDCSLDLQQDHHGHTVVLQLESWKTASSVSRPVIRRYSAWCLSFTFTGFFLSFLVGCAQDYTFPDTLDEILHVILRSQSAPLVHPVFFSCPSADCGIPHNTSAVVFSNVLPSCFIRRIHCHA